MPKRSLLLLIALLPVSACAYSGHLIQRDETGPGGVQYRAGTVPYKNDSKADRRKDDAVRKLAKFCGSDGYTITKEGPSPSADDMLEIQFRCVQASTTGAPTAK